MAKPTEQFEIKPLIEIKPAILNGADISFTNSALFMTISIVLIMAFMLLSVRSRALVPGRWQSMAEMLYEFVAGMIRDNVGREGFKYFPFIFSLFTFILFGNLLGMMPYSFTYTSHIIVTFAMALLVFVGTTLIAIAKHRMKFFGFFLPHGTPWYVAPLLIPIEILSYLIRPISLSLRLFANMTAGHTLLKVFASFVVLLGVAGIAPLVVTTALTGLEVVVAFLQAYVFATLTCIYLNDALHLH